MASARGNNMATKNSNEVQWYQDIYNQVLTKHEKTSTTLSIKDFVSINSEYFVVTKVLERTYKKLGKSIE